MQTIKTVYISNISEDVWEFITSLDPNTMSNEIEENTFLSDRAIFTLPDSSVFIAAKSISPQYKDYITSLIHLDDFHVIIPQNADGQLSLDLTNDLPLIKTLSQFGQINLTAYSSTSQLYQLHQKLIQSGLTVNLPLSPQPQHQDTVDNFGSKSGIRRLVESLKDPDIFMAPGQIFDSKATALKYASEKLNQSEGVVIKTNRGHAGMGVIVLPPGSSIPKTFETDAYWDKFPIVVEKYIDVDPSIGGGFPNLEYLIDASGRVQLLYSCGMSMSSPGVFSGVEIGFGALPSVVLDKMIKIGQKIGQKYSNSGYCGYFDIDFAAGKDGKLYITESNLRQTGGSHVYHLAQRLFGQDFDQKTYIISDNTFSLPPSNWTFSSISQLFQPILYNPDTKEGIVIVSENMLSRNQLSYVAFAPDRSKTLNLISSMAQLISKVTL